MTVLAMTLPLARSMLVRLSRRDVVAEVGDDLTLNLAVVADDTPGAAPVNLTAGTTVQMVLWSSLHGWDYGWLPVHDVSRSLYTGAATITNAAGGLATVTLPRDVGHRWPFRLPFSILLDLGGTTRTTLAYGMLHMPPAIA